jgi:hypothetical protein
MRRQNCTTFVRIYKSHEETRGDRLHGCAGESDRGESEAVYVSFSHQGIASTYFDPIALHYGQAHSMRQDFEHVSVQSRLASSGLSASVSSNEATYIAFTIPKERTHLM